MIGETMSDYLRCRHCRGFYETALSACKYCGQTVTFNNSADEAILFPDRDTCRAVQIAEYEQLPPEAHEDCMGPPPDDFSLLCACIHCGPDAPPFEAVEMRWEPDEKMWACPNTTCGGSGFSFDIHPLHPRWECFQCQHKWAPPGGNAKASNCKCPKCGCTQASGWFDDEHSEEEIEAMTDEEYKAAFGLTRQEDEARFKASLLAESSDPLPGDADMKPSPQEHDPDSKKPLNPDDIPF